MTESLKLPLQNVSIEAISALPESDQTSAKDILASLFPLLDKPRSDEGWKPYNQPASSLPLPGGRRFALTYQDNSDTEVYKDNALAFRGMVLGDLIVAAIFYHGYILSGDSNTSTRIALSSGNAQTYALAESNRQNAAERLYKIFYQFLGKDMPKKIYSRRRFLIAGQNVQKQKYDTNRLIMSQVVARFTNESINKTPGRTHTLVTKMMKASSSGYWNIGNPPLNILDLTPEFIAETERWSGINLLTLLETAEGK